MGMSASQARLLSLTSRMHDLEFQAQSIQYAKLDLVNSENAAYDEYLASLDATKYQMAVFSATGKEYADITYSAMINASATGASTMYILTNEKEQIMLPEQVALSLGPDRKNVDTLRDSISKTKEDGTEKTTEEMLNEYLVSVAKERLYPDGKDSNGNTLTTDESYIAAMKADNSYKTWETKFFQAFPDKDVFLLNVAKNYLYTGRADLEEDSDYINQMKSDGNYKYWNAVYHQMVGYTDEEGVPVAGRGYCTISSENATDTHWLVDSMTSGEVRLFKLTADTIKVDDEKMNIFAESNLATDPDLKEVEDVEYIKRASVKYEKAIKNIDAKETKLDMQLTQIDSQHNALKTEYESVKQIVSKSIDRSFKTFNA